jgi:hypothetical protein
MRGSWTLRAFVAAVAVDIALVPLAGAIGRNSASCGGTSGLWALFFVPWLAAPFAGLIVAGVHDERRGRADALGLAMGAVALVIATHLVVFVRMWQAAPSCGFF